MHRSSSTLSDRGAAHRIRGLGSLAASLFLIAGMFRFWPVPPGDVDLASRLTEVRPQEIIELEQIEFTVQNYTVPPAPPPPPENVLQPPVEVPDSRIIEERVQELELSLPSLNAVPNAPPSPPPGPVGPPQAPPSAPSPEPVLVRNPDRSPRPVRFSEPVYSAEARDADAKARVKVEVLVDEFGHGSDERIIERVLIGRGGREEIVFDLPFDLDEAALAAARRYTFRPAQDGGRAVRSYTTITLRVGI